MKLKLMRESQEELVTWAQQRFWLGAGLIVIVGIFGVRALVREMVAGELREATKATATANAAADQAKDVAKELRADAGKIRGDFEAIAALSRRIETDLSALRTKIEAESSHAIATADLKILALSEQLRELREVVERMAEESAQNTTLLEDYRTRVAALSQRAAKAQSSFARNAENEVLVVAGQKGSDFDQIGERLASHLNAAGFRTGRGWWGGSREFTGRVEIAHTPDTADAARAIAELVRAALRDANADLASVQLSESAAVGTGPRIRVFLE